MAVVFLAFGSESRAGSGDVAGRTIYNHCISTIWNNVPHTIKLTHIEKHSKDSWYKHQGPHDLKPPFKAAYGAPNTFSTESGFARGCWNILRWGDSHGTVEIYSFDPYSGHNRYHCKATGQYHCYHQESLGAVTLFDPDRFSGDVLNVNYKLCMTGKHCPGTHHEAPHYP